MVIPEECLQCSSRICEDVMSPALSAKSLCFSRQNLYLKRGSSFLVNTLWAFLGEEMEKYCTSNCGIIPQQPSAQPELFIFT